MKTTTAALLAITLSMLAFSSHAANPNPKPKCPLGQIAVHDGSNWECKQPDITSGEKPQEAGLLLPAVQKVREAAPSSAPAQPAGPKPSCPMGQIAKLELGLWQCQDMHITTPQKDQRAGYMKLGDIKGESQHAPGAGPRPKCPKGQLPKHENGQWTCKQPDYAAPQKPE